MLKDRYDNPLCTVSAKARDTYVVALDLLLAAQAGIVAEFEAVVAEDPGFALGWAGLARGRHFTGDMTGAAAAMARARSLAGRLSAREESHIHAMGLLVDGRTAEAYPAIRAHVDLHPRDALVAQTCSSVFGLIGFSGQPGREAETLAYVAGLLPHYGEDWWAISQYAFALCETGNLAKADALIDRSLAINPANANGAHVRSHVSYELGDTVGGLSYLGDWLDGSNPGVVLYGHLNWHVALWSLAQGETDAMWTRLDRAVTPEAGGSGPAINVLTDTVSILHRAALAGVEVAPERWAGVSAFAQRAFPKTGNAFVDVHAALAHAMAGDTAALERIIAHPAGPAADLVPDLAQGFRALAERDWAGASMHLLCAMADLARIGGSRAQRDLVEQSLISALLHQGRRGEAEAVVALRRPLLVGQLSPGASAR